MPTTEFVVAPLQPGIEIGQPDNAGAQTIKACGDTLSKAAGLQDIHFGMQVENANQFSMIVNWDSLDKHKEFMAQDSYQPFLDSFKSITTDKVSLFHADLQPAGAVSKALSAPVTEIATFYFGGEAPSDYLEGVLKFGQATEAANPEGYLGSAVGLIHEEVEKDGHKGKGAVLVVGWSSVDAHMKFRETQTFKDQAPALRNGVKTADVVHVALLSPA